VECSTCVGLETSWARGGSRLQASSQGHAVGKHVQGAHPSGPTAASARYATKFRSLDAMADALDRLLKTAAGQQALANLRAGPDKLDETAVEHSVGGAELDEALQVEFGR
jgi:hypothetical protein